MRTLVDANVLLRYLLNDSEELSLRAKEIVASGVWLLPEVLAEVVYVLSGVYAVERKVIAQALTELIEEVCCDSPAALCAALNKYAATRLDFIDCVLWAYNRVNLDTVVTFDKKLNKALED